MLNPTKAGILITLSLFTDFVQIAILATSLGTQGAITVLTLGIGAAVAGAAGFVVNILGVLFSLGFFVVRVILFQFVLKKDLVGTFKKRAVLRVFVYMVEFLPYLNILPLWTISSVVISLMKADPKKKKENFL